MEFIYFLHTDSILSKNTTSSSLINDITFTAFSNRRALVCTQLKAQTNNHSNEYIRYNKFMFNEKRIILTLLNKIERNLINSAKMSYLPCLFSTIT